jgi:hypothetical protein
LLTRCATSMIVGSCRTPGLIPCPSGANASITSPLLLQNSRISVCGR